MRRQVGAVMAAACRAGTLTEAARTGLASDDHLRSGVQHVGIAAPADAAASMHDCARFGTRRRRGSSGRTRAAFPWHQTGPAAGADGRAAARPDAGHRQGLDAERAAPCGVAPVKHPDSRDQARVRRRRIRPRPASPTPSSAMEAGSGAGVTNGSSN